MQNNLKIRNPLVTTPMGNLIKNIGDTHLGRVFKTDVALDRRGQYENFQKQTLIKELFSPIEDENAGLSLIRVQVGDWFDKAIVPPSDVLGSFKLLEQYNITEGIAPLYILSGNHDDSKNLSEKTSWDLLEQLIKPMVWTEAVKTWKVHTFPNGESIILIGWNVTTNAQEALLDAKEAGYSNITTAVCHLDRVSFGNDDNVIPYEFFSEQGIKMVISGHDHKPYHFFDYGMEIIGTGSLLPYSHAEDHNDDIYHTFKTVEDLQEYLETNPDVSSKHIRVYVDEDDVVPEVDAYSVKILKREVAEIDLNTGVELVSIDSYNPKKVWEKTAEDNLLTKDVADQIWLEIKKQGIEE